MFLIRFFNEFNEIPFTNSNNKNTQKSFLNVFDIFIVFSAPVLSLFITKTLISVSFVFDSLSNEILQSSEGAS